MADYYDPAELLNAVPIGAEAARYKGGAELSEDDAVLALLVRFGFVARSDESASDQLRDNDRYVLNLGGDRKLAKELAFWNFDSMQAAGIAGSLPERDTPVLETVIRTIIKALPPEYRNQEFLARVDVRPWITELVGKNMQSRRNRRFGPDSDVGTGDLFRQDMADAFNDQFARLAKEAALQPLVGTPAYDQTDKQVTSQLDSSTSSAGVVPQPTGTGTSIVDEFASSGDAEGFSEQDLRTLFTRRQETDIMSLEAIMSEYGGTYTMPAEPTLGLANIGLEPAISVEEDRGVVLGQPVGARVNFRAAADYLYSGKVTPTEVTNLQRKMVAAGLFDSPQMADGYAAGDVFDMNTNTAWRTLLAQAFTRNKTVQDTLSEMTKERQQRLPSLRENVNKRVFNLAAQDLIGRDLTDAEQAGLTNYLRGLREQQGLASMGASVETGYGEQEVSTYLAKEFDTEIDQVSGVSGTLNALRALRG